MSQDAQAINVGDVLAKNLKNLQKLRTSQEDCQELADLFEEAKKTKEVAILAELSGGIMG